MFNEWYLARDNSDYLAGDDLIKAHPTALTGVVKRQGCIEFATTDKGYNRDLATDTDGGLWMGPVQCKKIFGHCPKKGELLCVKKTRKGWESEKIELEFS